MLQLFLYIGGVKPPFFMVLGSKGGMILQVPVKKRLPVCYIDTYESLVVINFAADSVLNPKNPCGLAKWVVLEYNGNSPKFY